MVLTIAYFRSHFAGFHFFKTDAFISEVWDYAQGHPQYKDKTTMIITTDHGRGTVPKDTWRSHGTKISGADQIWIAVIGPDTPALGIVKDNQQYYQNQVTKNSLWKME